MKPDVLARLGVPGGAVSFDCETHLIQPGLLAPPLVCGSIAVMEDDGVVRGELLGKRAALETFRDLMNHPTVVVVMANGAFDTLVCAVEWSRLGVDIMPAVFAKYRRGEVLDVQHAEALRGIARGHLNLDWRTMQPLRDPLTGELCRYRLSVVVQQVLGRVDAKANDEYRGKYALLEHVPIEEWPPLARQYPVDDAVNTLEAGIAQCGYRPKTANHLWGDSDVCRRCGATLDFGAAEACWVTAPHENLHDHAPQTFKALCLHLNAAWGIRTDGAAIEFLASVCQAARDAGSPEFQALGYLRPNMTEDGALVRSRVAVAYGVDPLSECPNAREVDPATKCVRGKIFKKFSVRDPSVALGKGTNCVRCNGTGMDLDSSGVVPRTDPTEKFPHGQVRIGRDQLSESGDEHLMAYGASQEDDKILDTYIPWLREGVAQPIALRPNPILETARVSYSGPVQLLPRQVSARLAHNLRKERDRLGGACPLVLGVRDCIVPRAAQFVEVEVPDDYVLQPGEEIVP